MASVDKQGRAIARELYPDRPCETCGKVPSGRGGVDRHHRSGDRSDNSARNIVFLCRQHHMDAHRLLDGKVGGGPRPRITALMHDRAVRSWTMAAALLAQGMSHEEVAADFGVHPATVWRWQKKYGGRGPA